MTNRVLPLLAIAMVIAGCDRLVVPKPDTSGDAAVASTLTAFCSAATLAPIDSSANMMAIRSAPDVNNAAVLHLEVIAGPAYADNETVSNLEAVLTSLTPTISDASPFAPTAVDLAELLTDMSKQYLNIVFHAESDVSRARGNVAAIDETEVLHDISDLTLTRANEARSDLARIGINGCLG